MKYCVNATLDLNGLAFGIVEVGMLYFGRGTIETWKDFQRFSGILTRFVGEGERLVVKY